MSNQANSSTRQILITLVVLYRWCFELMRGALLFSRACEQQFEPVWSPVPPHLNATN